MGLDSFVRSKFYQQLTAKLYGWGASLVIIGALFKLQHYEGASILLILGMGTESLIFFVSAFEPLHVEFDWSLVYPEFAGMNDQKADEKKKKRKRRGKETQERGYNATNRSNNSSWCSRWCNSYWRSWCNSTVRRYAFK